MANQNQTHPENRCHPCGEQRELFDHEGETARLAVPVEKGDPITVTCDTPLDGQDPFTLHGTVATTVRPDGPTPGVHFRDGDQRYSVWSNGWLIRLGNGDECIGEDTTATVDQ